MIKRIITTAIICLQLTRTALQSFILQSQSYIRTSVHDNLAIGLDKMLNLKGISNITLSSPQIGVSIKTPFSKKSQSYIQGKFQNCKLTDNRENYGFLFLCQEENKLNFMNRFFNVQSVGLTIDQSEFPSGYTGTMICKSACFTNSGGIYVVCFVNQTQQQIPNSTLEKNLIKKKSGKNNIFEILKNYGKSQKNEKKIKKKNSMEGVGIKVFYVQVDKFSDIIQPNNSRYFEPKTEDLTQTFNLKIQLHFFNNSQHSRTGLIMTQFGTSAAGIKTDCRILKMILNSKRKQKKEEFFDELSFIPKFSNLSSYFACDSLNMMKEIPKDREILFPVFNESDFLVISYRADNEQYELLSFNITEKSEEFELLELPKFSKFQQFAFSLDGDYFFTFGQNLKNSNVYGLKISSIYKAADSDFIFEDVDFSFIFDDEIDRVSFLSNNFSIVARLYGQNDDYLASFIFDKKRKSGFLDNEKVKNFIDIFPRNEFFYKMIYDGKGNSGVYYYQLSNIEIMIDGKKIIQRRGNPKFSLSIYIQYTTGLTSSQEPEHRISQFPIQGEVIKDLIGYLDTISFLSVIQGINKIQFHIPVDFSTIRGQNLVFTPENSTDFSVDTNISHSFQLKYDKTKFNILSTTSKIVVIYDLFVQIKQTGDTLKGQVFKAVGGSDFYTDLNLVSLNEFSFQGDSDSEVVLSTGKVNDKYYFMLTKDDSKRYFLYFLISPNFVVTSRVLNYKKMDLVIMPNEDQQDMKTMITYIADFVGQRIEIFSFDAQNEENDKHLGTLTPQDLNLEFFCPFSIKRGYIYKNILFVASVCSENSKIIQIDISRNSTLENKEILLLNPYQEFNLCPITDQFLVSNNDGDIYGVRSAEFVDDYIYYELEYLNIIKKELVQYKCLMYHGIAVFVYKVQSPVFNFAILILKGGNAFDADKRVYKIINFGKQTENVFVESFNNGILIMEQIKNQPEYQITRVRFQGPKFSAFASLDHLKPNSTADISNYDIGVERGRNKATIQANFQIVEPLFIPNLKKKNGFEWNGKFELDKLFEVDGPLYGLEIWKNEKVIKGKNDDDSGPKKLVNVGLLANQTTEFIQIGGQIGEYFDFTTGSSRTYYITGYSKSEGFLSIIKKDFEVNSTFKIPQNCSCADHVEFPNQIFVALICDVKNANKLVTLIIDLASGKFKILGQREGLTEVQFEGVRNLEVFKTSEIGTLIIRLDMYKSSIALKYYLKVDFEAQVWYDYVEVVQYIQNCNFIFSNFLGFNIQSIETDELIIFIYNDQNYYEFLSYIILEKQQAGELVAASKVEVRREIYSNSFFCNNLLYKKQRISCIISTRKTVFYELVLDISTQEYALVHNYIADYNQYLNFHMERAVATIDFLIIQGYKTRSDQLRSLLVYKRQTEIIANPYLYFALNQTEYCLECSSPVEIYIELPNVFIMRTKARNHLIEKIKIFDERKFFSNISIPYSHYRYFNVVLTYPGDLQPGLNSSMSLLEIMTKEQRSTENEITTNLGLLGLFLFSIVGILIWVYFYEDKRELQRVGMFFDIMDLKEKKTSLKKKVKVKGSIAILSKKEFGSGGRSRGYRKSKSRGVKSYMSIIGSLAEEI